MQDPGPLPHVVSGTDTAAATDASPTSEDVKRVIRRPRRRYTQTTQATKQIPEPLQGMVFAEPPYHIRNEQRLVQELGPVPASVKEAGGDKAYCKALYKHARRLQQAAWSDGLTAINLAERDALIAWQREDQPFTHGMRRHRGQEIQRQLDRDTADQRVAAARDSFHRLCNRTKDAAKVALLSGPEPWTDCGPCARCQYRNNHRNSNYYTACFCQTYAFPPSNQATWISLEGETSRWLLGLPLPTTVDQLEHGDDETRIIDITGLDGALVYFGTKNKLHLALLSWNDYYDHPHEPQTPREVWRRTCAKYTCNYGAFASKIQRAYRRHHLVQVHRILQAGTTLDSDVSKYCVCAYLMG
jgi:hypothetical protein